MITNPFARKPKSPLDQALDVVSNVRSDAAETAASIRDAAAKAADALGEPRIPEERKLPILAIVGAAVLGVALAIRARAGGRSSAPAPAPPPPAPSVATAAKSTVTEPKAAGGSKPAAEVAPEKPKEPKAVTEESEAAS